MFIHLGVFAPRHFISFDFCNSRYIHDKFEKWSRGRVFTYAQHFSLNAACTAASPANNYT